MIGQQLRIAILIFIFLTVITGVLYPILITGISQAFIHHQANGSLIYRNGKAVGSSLIGQQFNDPEYLWGRPSATSPAPYNSASSAASNIGPSNPAFKEIIETRIRILKSADPRNTNPIPVDLITSSASGLDPHISPAAAYYQIPRIARTRGIPEDAVMKIIQVNSSRRLFGCIGENVVNVVKVNLDLGSYKK